EVIFIGSFSLVEEILIFKLIKIFKAAVQTFFK
ncbi:hypothetical protein Mgra_00005229, partial [Meloidogyne graminicola]